MKKILQKSLNLINLKRVSRVERILLFTEWDKELDEIIEISIENEKKYNICYAGSSGVGKTTFVRSYVRKNQILKTKYLEIKLDNYKQNTPLQKSIL